MITKCHSRGTLENKRQTHTFFFADACFISSSQCQTNRKSRHFDKNIRDKHELQVAEAAAQCTVCALAYLCPHVCFRQCVACSLTLVFPHAALQPSAEALMHDGADWLRVVTLQCYFVPSLRMSYRSQARVSPVDTQMPVLLKKTMSTAVFIY